MTTEAVPTRKPGETRGTKPYKQWYQSEQRRRLREHKRSAAANQRADRFEAEARALRVRVQTLELQANIDPHSFRNVKAREALIREILDAPEYINLDPAAYSR